jgi:hypothetical protein
MNKPCKIWRRGTELLKEIEMKVEAVSHQGRSGLL